MRRRMLERVVKSGVMIYFPSRAKESPEPVDQHQESSQDTSTEIKGKRNTWVCCFCCCCSTEIKCNGNGKKGSTWCSRIWSQVSDHIIVEILCRLPDDCLVRYKCVSRSWYNLITEVCVPRVISSAPFSGLISASALLSKRDDGALFLPCPATSKSGCNFGIADPYSRFLPFKSHRGDFLDCCNGLLLYRRGCCIRRTVFHQYYVFNPVTKQCVAVPTNHTHTDEWYAALAFNPCVSPEYKVVCFRDSSSTPLKLDMFSSHTGEWISKEVVLEHTISSSAWVDRCIYLDDVLYRLSASQHLLCFNLSEPSVCAVQLPDKECCVFRSSIGASKSHLYFSCNDGFNLLIWMLNVDHQVRGWTLMHSFCVTFLSGHHLDVKPCLMNTACLLIFAMHPTSDVIYVGNPRIVVGYHIASNRMELIYRAKRDNMIWRGVNLVFPYTRCLVNLKTFKDGLYRAPRLCSRWEINRALSSSNK